MSHKPEPQISLKPEVFATLPIEAQTYIQVLEKQVALSRMRSIVFPLEFKSLKHACLRIALTVVNHQALMA